MAHDGIDVGMTPSHPGDFIRTEVIEDLGLTVTRAADILGVRRATLSDLLNGNASLSPEMALTRREGLRREYGSAPADAGLARRLTDAGKGERDSRPTLPTGLTTRRPCAPYAGRPRSRSFLPGVASRKAMISRQWWLT